MGFFKSLFDREHLGEEVVKNQVKAFFKGRELYPGQNQHFHLAHAWLSRASARGVSGKDESVQMVAFTETQLFACVQAPDCAVALGVYILKQERPDIYDDYPRFQEQFNKIMEPVFKAMDEGKIEALYRKLNPKN